MSKHKTDWLLHLSYSIPKSIFSSTEAVICMQIQHCNTCFPRDIDALPIITTRSTSNTPYHTRTKDQIPHGVYLRLPQCTLDPHRSISSVLLTGPAESTDQLAPANNGIWYHMYHLRHTEWTAWDERCLIKFVLLLIVFLLLSWYWGWVGWLVASVRGLLSMDCCILGGGGGSFDGRRGNKRKNTTCSWRKSSAIGLCSVYVLWEQSFDNTRTIWYPQHIMLFLDSRRICRGFEGIAISLSLLNFMASCLWTWVMEQKHHHLCKSSHFPTCPDTAVANRNHCSLHFHQTLPVVWYLADQKFVQLSTQVMVTIFLFMLCYDSQSELRGWQHTVSMLVALQQLASQTCHTCEKMAPVNVWWLTC